MKIRITLVADDGTEDVVEQELLDASLPPEELAKWYFYPMISILLAQHERV